MYPYRSSQRYCKQDQYIVKYGTSLWCRRIYPTELRGHIWILWCTQRPQYVYTYYKKLKLKLNNYIIIIIIQTNIMDPEFKAIFRLKTCMAKQPNKCIKYITKLNNDSHIFSKSEFNTVMDRLAYGKEKAPIAINNPDINNVLSIMLQHRDLSKCQLDEFIDCCKSSKAMPLWIDIFLSNCYLESYPIDQLKRMRCSDEKIMDALKNTKISVGHVLNVLEQDFGDNGYDSDGSDDSDDNNKNKQVPNPDIMIWTKLPKEKIDTYLLNAVLEMDYNGYNELLKIIIPMLKHGIVPNDQTVRLLCDSFITDVQILKYLAVHNLMNHDIIRMLCKSGKVFDVLDPEYKIIITIDIFNIIFECCKFLEPYIDSQTIKKLKIAYSDDHIAHSINTTSKSNSSRIDTVFSIIKFWQFTGIPANNYTLNLACSRGLIELVKICIGKYNVIPNNDHLELALRYDTRVCHSGMINKHEIIKEILVCKVTPDASSFKCLFNNNIFDQAMFNILVKFGLSITFDDIIYALQNLVLIDDLERFNVPYDSKLYYQMFINNVDVVDIIGKFTIDIRVMKLHQLCKNHSLTLEKLKKFMGVHKIRIDRYSIDNIARCQNRTLLIKLLLLIDSPNQTALILLAGSDTKIDNETYDDIGKIYNRTLERLGADHEYMAATYDIDI
jgi:hypothetical protein